MQQRGELSKLRCYSVYVRAGRKREYGSGMECEGWKEGKERREGT